MQNQNFLVTTERLILRDFQESDWQRFVELHNDSSVKNNFLSFQLNDDYIQRSFESGFLSKEQNPRLNYFLAIVLKEQETIIGTCSISGTLAGYENTGIGWHVESSYTGKGYATESAGELLRLGFHKHNVERVIAECFADNRASRRVMEKNGMTIVSSGLLTRWIRGAYYGEKKPIVRYQINRAEWFAKNSSNK
ncbi:MAG: GNAT family N-acetyltransferase [Acidobacteriota bacterium]